MRRIGFLFSAAAALAGALLPGPSYALPAYTYLPPPPGRAPTRSRRRSRNKYSGADLRMIRADPTRAECQRRKAQMARIAEKRAAKPMRWAA